jgi:hypothetical protein
MWLLSEEAGIHRSHSLPLQRGGLIGIDGGNITKRERHNGFWVGEARRGEREIERVTPGSRQLSVSDGVGEGMRKRDERQTQQSERLCESYSNGRVRELVI